MSQTKFGLSFHSFRATESWKLIKPDVIACSVLIMLISWSLVSSNPTSVQQMPYLKHLMNPCGISRTSTGSQAHPHSESYAVGKLMLASKLTLVHAKELEEVMGLSECNSVSHGSLVHVPKFDNAQLADVLRGMHKTLLNYLSHMYFIDYEREHSLKWHCRISIAEDLQGLAGMLQDVLCEVLQARGVSYSVVQTLSEVKTHPPQLHSSCSAAEIEKCLIVRYVVQLLQEVINRLEEDPLSRTNHLDPTLNK